MATRVVPGFAFSLVTDLGFAVGVVSHQVARTGDLVWIAEPVSDSQPELDDVRRIATWRWPIFFATGAAVKQKLVQPIGVIDLPPTLRKFPRMRGGARGLGWTEVDYSSGTSRIVGKARDASLPVAQGVNMTALKEMIITGYRPADDW